MIVQDVLLSTPGTIREVMLEAFKHKDKQEAALMRAKLREADIALQVAKATTPEGKKAFSNESERDGETKRRLQTDDAYNAARNECDEERAIGARIEAALTYQRNRLRAALALSTSTGNLDLDFPDVA